MSQITFIEPEKNRAPFNYSGNFERYTPQVWIEAARKTMIEIHLDPASCEWAQKNNVKAEYYYTRADNALIRPWFGNVFCNPPYHKNWILPFIEKLLRELKTGLVNQAIVLTGGGTETVWGQKLRDAGHIFCRPRRRIAFYDERGRRLKNPIQGNLITGFNVCEKRFLKYFGPLGHVFTPLRLPQKDEGLGIGQQLIFKI